MLCPMLALAIAMAPVAAPATNTHPFSVDDMLAMQRISEPAVSPDGRRVAFTLRTTDLDGQSRPHGRVAGVDRRLWLAPPDDA